MDYDNAPALCVMKCVSDDPGAAEAMESGDEFTSRFSSAAVFSQSARRRAGEEPQHQQYSHVTLVFYSLIS